MASRVCHSSRTAARARRPRARCMPEVRRHGSCRGPLGTARDEVLELLAGPLGLAGLLELAAERLPQLDQRLDVERGVLQPRLGQRPGGPVDGRVLLAQAAADDRLDQGGQADPRVAEQPTGELGVEQGGGAQADLGQAGEVLGGGVQDPLGVAERGVQRGQVAEGDRVDERGAGALTAQLHEVGARRSSGSPRPARRRWPPGRCPRRAPRPSRPAPRGCRRPAAARRAGSAAEPARGASLGARHRRAGLVVDVYGVGTSGRRISLGRAVRVGSASSATPSGTGGRPDAVHSSSPHASTCGPRSSGPSPSGSATGVQEARISSWAVASSSAMLPKLSEDTLVTVPEGAT